MLATEEDPVWNDITLAYDIYMMCLNISHLDKGKKISKVFKYSFTKGVIHNGPLHKANI